MTIVAGILLLGILIFFHELGHFVVAKACGVRVLTFSLGFGPRLIGFTIGDTDYRLSALPLGGYVKMYGDDLHDEVPPEEKRRAFLHQPVWRKAAIAFAGPFANFLLPFVVLFVGVLGTEVVSDAVVGTVMPTEPAAKAGMMAGDRIVAVDGEPVALFSDLVTRVGTRPEQEVRLTVARGDEQKELVVVPRAVGSAHPLEKGEVTGRIGILAIVARPIVDVVPGSLAERAGLQSQDLVRSIDGAPITRFTELQDALRARLAEPVTLVVTALEKDAPERTITIPAPDLAAVLVTAQDELARFGVTRDEEDEALVARVGKTTQLVADEAAALVARRGIGLAEGVITQVAEESAAARLGLAPGARVVAVDGAPLTQAGEIDQRLDEDPQGVHTVGVVEGTSARTLVFRMTARTERGLEELRYFGVRPTTVFGDGAMVTRDVGVVEAGARALAGTWSLIAETAKGIFALITGQVSMKSIGGPITIFKIAGDAMELGIERWLRLLLVISVNLGLLNLLPVPVLDGGHLLLFTIEAVKRKELTLRTKERALKVGFATLLALMAFALVNDVLRLITG